MLPILLPLPGTGITVATYEGGDSNGPPVFFLHGNSLAADTFGRQWQEPALQRFRLVAMDLPGHGHSPAAPGHYSVPAMRAVVQAAMQALGVAHAVAVGHSYGETCCWSCCRLCPVFGGLSPLGRRP